MNLCVRGIDLAYDFSIRSWNYFDSVVSFVLHLLTNNNNYLYLSYYYLS